MNNSNVNTENKNVYGYIRVSTETQADKGYGLETQEQAIKEYCKANNLNLINVYTDAGISGAIGDKDDLSSRPALCEMLDILNGTNTIIVMNTSRLWRDDVAKVLICRAVRKLNGEIFSIEQPRYSLYAKDPTEVLFNTLMEALDQYERMTINQRLSKGKTTKAKNGYKPAGKAPFGYKWIDKNIETNLKEANIIKEIFQLAIDNTGYQTIADILNKHRKYNRNQKEWSRQDIYRTLKNKFYIGILTHKGEEIQGKHETIIDRDIWEAINNK